MGQGWVSMSTLGLWFVDYPCIFNLIFILLLPRTSAFHALNLIRLFHWLPKNVQLCLLVYKFLFISFLSLLSLFMLILFLQSLTSAFPVSFMYSLKIQFHFIHLWFYIIANTFFNLYFFKTRFPCSFGTWLGVALIDLTELQLLLSPKCW